LGFIDDNIIFQKEKVVKKGVYYIFYKKLKGFGIPYGISPKYSTLFPQGYLRAFLPGLWRWNFSIPGKILPGF